MAYGSTSIFENLATVFAIAEASFFFFLFVMLMRFCCSPMMKFKWFRKSYGEFHKAVFWGSFLRIGLEVFMELSVATQLNIRNYQEQYNLSGNQLHDDFSYYFSFLCAIFLVVFPIFAAIFLL